VAARQSQPEPDIETSVAPSLSEADATTEPAVGAAAVALEMIASARVPGASASLFRFYRTGE